MKCSVRLNPGTTSYINVFVRKRSIDFVTRREIFTPVNTASVTVTIKDSTGTAITGVAFPLAVPFVSNGNYAGTISGDLNLVDGQQVKVHIDISEAGQTYKAEQFVIPEIPALAS